MLFKVESSKLNEYGYAVKSTGIRRAFNAWELSEELRKEGWLCSTIKQIK